MQEEIGGWGGRKKAYICIKGYKFTHVFTAMLCNSSNVYKIHSYITSEYKIGLKLFKIAK